MAKTTAPLFGFQARGQIGQSIVFGSWRGTSYARRHVTPSNPQTSEQTLTRNLFSWLQATYKSAPALFTAPWEAYIAGKPLTGRNAFTKFNLPNMREETDLELMVGSPGALGGPPPASISLVDANDQTTVTVNAPSVTPVGWTLTGRVAAAIQEQDPQSGILYRIVAGTHATDPIVLALVPGAVDWHVMAWLVWTRPDGKTAYSPSLQDTASPT